MFIVLEGVDCAGKGTIAKAVADKLNGDTRLTHLGPPRSADSALSECIDEEPYASYSPGRSANIVADRLHWGCPVYGPVFRPERDFDGYGDFGVAGWRYIEMFLASRGAISVFVDVDASTALLRLASRGDADYLPGVLEAAMPQLVDNYRHLQPDSMTCVTVLHEPSVDAIELISDDIIKTASIYQHRAAPLADWPDYVGTVAPEVLVVMRPDRDERFDVVSSVDDWQRVGICSSAHDHQSLEGLSVVLGSPQIVSVGPVTADVDQFIYSHLGTSVRDPGDVRHALKL